MRAIGIAIPFFRRRSAIDAQAQVHFNRVIADGGVVPSGLSGVNAFFSAVKAIYGTSDINTAISAAYDAHYLGYKLGAGSGTTLGQAAQKLYAPKGIFGGIGTGSAYWEGVGVTGNYVQTPSAAINQITGDIEIVARISISDEVGEKTIISKRSGANASYVLSSTSKLLRFRINTTTYDSNASHTFAVNEVYWAKVTRQQSNGEIKFFTSLNGTTWTQLGTTIVGITDSIAVNSVPVIVGVLGDLNSFSMKGNIYRATIANSIGGTPVVDFNANQYTGANTWTSTTSEVWTVNSTGAGLADVTQTTAASQPLLLAHTGENYWWGSGVNGNFVSTPNAAANQITGDIDLIAFINMTTTSYRNILTKDDAASNRQFIFSINNTLQLGLNFGAGIVTYNSTINIPSGANVWIRATRNATNGEIRFFTSNDASTTNPQSVTWTQLGTTVSGSTGSTINGNSVLCVGAQSASGVNAVLGRIFRATISNSIGGTPVVDFNPASYNPATSQTQWSSATGEVWSLNVGTATSGYKSALVDRSIVQGDGVDDEIKVTGLSTIPLVSVHQAKSYFPASISSKIGHLISTLASGSGEFGTAASSTRYYSNNAYFIAQFAPGGLRQSHFAKYKTNAQDFKVNNGASPAITNQAFSGFNCVVLFSGNGASYMNLTYTTFIVSSVDENSTQTTAMYNALKSYNNNAF